MYRIHPPYRMTMIIAGIDKHQINRDKVKKWFDFWNNYYRHM